MLREAPTPGRASAYGSIKAGRRWHGVPSAPVPAHPARLEVIAGVSLHCEQRRPTKRLWDDRIETAGWTLAAQLWKLGRGQKTGTFATTSKQLTWALGKGPMRSTWGAPPVQMDGSAAEKYWRAHRRSVSRWLDALAGAGHVRCSGRRDNQGYWWRMEVELLAVDASAEAFAERVELARLRDQDFEKRRRRARARGVRRDLGEIRAAGEPLDKAARRLAGIQRRRAIGAARRRHRNESGDLAQPFGDSPSYDGVEGAFWEQQAKTDHFSKRRGAHARGVPSLRSELAGLSHLDPQLNGWLTLTGSPREGTNGGESREHRLALGHGGLGVPSGALTGAGHGPRGRIGLEGPIAPAIAEIGRLAPTAGELDAAVIKRMTEAWWLAVRGVPADAMPVLDDVAEARDLLGTLRQYAASYERQVEHRPPGWPTSGAAALLLLAAIEGQAVTSLQLAERHRNLAEHMRLDRVLGGKAVRSIGDLHAPPQVAAGYESGQIMRRRLTEQLRSAGDNIERYGSLRAAEAAAIEHERTGRLPVGLDPDWDAPWNAGQHPTIWPSPRTQQAWRDAHYPLPHAAVDGAAVSVDPPVNPLLDPERYAAAAAAVRAAGPGAELDGALAEHLVHAWHAERYTLAGAIARWDWRPRAPLAKISAVAEAYEALGDVRPAGWPASGLHALMVLATWRDPGSTTLDGKPVRMSRPDTLPGAVERLAIIVAEMRRHTERGAHIERSTRRGRRRLARQHGERIRAAAAAPRFQFRAIDLNPAALPHPATETPSMLRRRIADQLIAAGDHAGNHASLEDAELALIDLEEAGRLPAGNGPSPAAMRLARHEHETALGSQTLGEDDWLHLVDVAAALLPASAGELLNRLSPTAIVNGTLVIAAAAEDLDDCRQLQLAKVLGQLASHADLASAAGILDKRAAAALAPKPSELTGPADPTAARGDRYADERLTRYAI